MREGKASWTAELTAVHRAVESMKPENERICYDPIAKNFMSTSARLIGKSRFLMNIAMWYASERPWPGEMGTVVARTRYIDDYVDACIQNGIQQLVILGAGFDSRAYRISGLAGKVKVFELDWPETQELKIGKIKRIFGVLPEHVVYVPIDFNKEKLDQKLPQSGYDRGIKTLFIWEGVTMYLTAEGVDETLAFVYGNSGEGSSIVFDYLQYSDEYDPDGLKMLRKCEETVRKRCEPWTFGLQRGAIEGFLTQRGFHQVVNATAKDLKSSYFGGRNQKRKLFPFLPVVHATVKPRA